MKKILLALFIVILVFLLLLFYKLQNSKTSLPQISTSQQQNTLEDYIETCPENVSTIKLFDLSINNDGSFEGLAFYKQRVTETNNFDFFDDRCKISISDLLVFGPYIQSTSTWEIYEYTEFAKLDTWNNYYENRLKERNYVTNVFNVSRTDSGVVLIELYQE